MAGAVRHPLQRTLEVERKFCGLKVPQLTSDAGIPAFATLQRLREQHFHDTYYDDQGKLSSKGVWLRKRQYRNETPVWQLKCRHGGSFINSMFEEISDVRAIADRVRGITGQDEAVMKAEEAFGLESIASLATCRKSWLADLRFTIVLDTTDFGHEVGEVELERTLTIPRQACSVDIETWKTSVTREMDLQIQAFMGRYWWAFRPGIPKGKLSAYFEWQGRQNI